MRILWLKSDLLLPLDKGGRLRTWHLMRHLVARHEITYVAFAEPGQLGADGKGLSHATAAAMQTVARRVEVVPRRDPRKGSWRLYADVARHLLDPLPYSVGKYRSAQLHARLQQLLDRERFDLLVCDFLVPAVNLPERLPCPAVMFTHNVESEIWRRHAEMQRRLIPRVLFRTQYRRMLRFEARTLARFDGVLVVSDIDRQTLARLYPRAIAQPAYVVPTGVDTAYFAPSGREPEPRQLVFTGSMDWLPNEDAMVFFCRDVLTRIAAAEPDVRLSIVGRAPTPAVRRLAGTGVEVTGDVEDVRPYVGRAALYVVPLRIGGGTRLKIFEAMSMGKAVVSTSVGAEGLPVADGVHLALADDPRAFAAAVVGLLRNRDRRRRLEQAARALVVERYDWSVVSSILEAALTRVAENPRRLASTADHAGAGIEVGREAARLT